jgi:hypothetical protein
MARTLQALAAVIASGIALNWQTGGPLSGANRKYSAHFEHSRFWTHTGHSATPKKQVQTPFSTTISDNIGFT